MHGMKRRAVLGLGAAFGLSRLAGARAQAATASLATLSDGGFSLPATAAARRNPDEVRAALREAGLPTDSMQTVLNVTVLRRGEEAILIDCGGGRNFVPGVGKLPEALEAAGIAPEAVTHVLFTHGHPDHLWGVVDDFDTPAFPKAKHHFPAAEWDYWFSEGIFRSLPEDRQSFAAGAQRMLKIIEPLTSRFRPGQEVAPGVLAVDAAGHTPGHVAFEALTDSGMALVVGDALTHPVLSFRYPDWPGGFDADGERAAATRKALLARAAADRLLLVGYHLPNGGVGRVEAAGAAWRFVQPG
jgi:glyoxylase-like metal-dependent hydrolase (beta-lactamase superfamily II)